MLSFHPWSLVTRLGESGLLLPCALLIAASLAMRRRDWRPALLWLLPLALAALLTTLTKIAFMGFGIGSAALDFTGISGHSMFAAAVYPMLGFAVASGAADRRLRVAAVGAGYGLALLVAISRWKLGMHSPSECVLGFLVGAAASSTALSLLAHPPWPSLRLTGLAALVVVLATLVPQRDDPLLPTHEMVTWVSLKLSGRSEPYTRADLHRLRAGAGAQPTLR